MSPIALVKGFLPSMKKRAGRCQIVTITSIAGQFGTPMRTFYCTSKFAIDGFSKALAAEVGNDVHVCICYPAYVQTNIAKSALIGKGVPMGKTDSNIGNGIKV
jgi:NAD(P)-dependent dehydrogenase (short-subunit alcohol dehydrogenase family)